MTFSSKAVAERLFDSQVFAIFFFSIFAIFENFCIFNHFLYKLNLFGDHIFFAWQKFKSMLKLLRVVCTNLRFRFYGNQFDISGIFSFD